MIEVKSWKLRYGSFDFLFLFLKRKRKEKKNQNGCYTSLLHKAKNGQKLISSYTKELSWIEVRLVEGRIIHAPFTHHINYKLQQSFYNLFKRVIDGAWVDIVTSFYMQTSVQNNVLPYRKTEKVKKQMKKIPAASCWTVKKMRQCFVCVIVKHYQGFSDIVWWESHFSQEGVAIHKFSNLKEYRNAWLWLHIIYIYIIALPPSYTIQKEHLVVLYEPVKWCKARKAGFPKLSFAQE